MALGLQETHVQTFSLLNKIHVPVELVGPHWKSMIASDLPNAMLRLRKSLHKMLSDCRMWRDLCH